VTFTRRHRSIPLILSSPAFAVAAPSYESGWPVGSGPFSLDGRAPSSMRRGIIASPAFGGTAPVIRFVYASVRDARDLIDNEVDVLITADPDVIDYAKNRGNLATVALPWNQTYVLLSTARAATLRDGGDAEMLSLQLRDGLAGDAVRNDARGSEQPFWWRDVDDCDDLALTFASPSDDPAHSPSAGPHRIIYDEEDPVARDLAQRIVALASGGAEQSSAAAEIAAALPRPNGNAARITADGVTADEMAWSLRAGNEFAYIVALPNRVADPCFEARKLLRRAPWLSTVGKALPDALVPLVDTRSHLIADGDKVGAAVDWYGNILLYGWSLEGDDLP
jgi:hypothetical protein